MSKDNRPVILNELNFVATRSMAQIILAIELMGANLVSPGP